MFSNGKLIQFIWNYALIACVYKSIIWKSFDYGNDVQLH